MTLNSLSLYLYIYTKTSTVITGRVIRDLVVVQVNTLHLKQIFVRHVSHEIRCTGLLVVVLQVSLLTTVWFRFPGLRWMWSMRVVWTCSSLRSRRPTPRRPWCPSAAARWISSNTYSRPASRPSSCWTTSCITSRSTQARTDCVVIAFNNYPPRGAIDVHLCIHTLLHINLSMYRHPFEYVCIRDFQAGVELAWRGWISV